MGRMLKKTLKLYQCLLSTLSITNAARISYSKDNQWVNEGKTVSLLKNKSNNFFKDLPILLSCFHRKWLSKYVFPNYTILVPLLFHCQITCFWLIGFTDKSFWLISCLWNSRQIKKDIEFLFSLTSWNWWVVFKELAFLTK